VARPSGSESRHLANMPPRWAKAVDSATGQRNRMLNFKIEKMKKIIIIYLALLFQLQFLHKLKL